MAIDKINYQGDSKVIKRIVNAINDLIDGGGGGGSTVSYTQTLSSGTKTGEIEIDGVSTDMYAPTPPSALSELSDDSTHRVVTDTEKTTWSGKVSDNPTFTEASTRANIASGETFATILGKIKKYFTDLKSVAFSGSYTDLSDKPTIPTVNDGTLTIQQDGTTLGTFTANQSGNTTVNITGGGGGGDSVSWNQIEQSGTKIAEIEINGTTTDVYSPSGGSGEEYIIIDETSAPVMTFDTDYVEVSNHNFVLVQEWTATSTSVSIVTGYCTKVTPYITGITVSDVEIA